MFIYASNICIVLGGIYWLQSTQKKRKTWKGNQLVKIVVSAWISIIRWQIRILVVHIYVAGEWIPYKARQFHFVYQPTINMKMCKYGGMRVENALTYV